MILQLQTGIQNYLITASKTAKPERLHINENLFPIRKTFIYVLCKAKKQLPHIISGSTSMNGNVYVWIKPLNSSDPNSRHTKMTVNTHASLDKFCQQDNKL